MDKLTVDELAEFRDIFNLVDRCDFDDFSESLDGCYLLSFMHFCHRAELDVDSSIKRN